MPRAFLVKKAAVATSRRNWSELPDEERGEIYIPVTLGLAAHWDETACSFSQPPSCYGAIDLSRHGATNPSSRGMQLSGEGNTGQALDVESQEQGFLRPKMKVTGGDSPRDSFSCHICQKSFTYQRMLTRHMKCHNEVKRHLCTYCGKGFNDTFDLKRHVRTHTGVRPYKCSLCDKAFTQRCSLESHLKKIHGVQQHYAYKERRTKLYVCEACGFTADSQEASVLHLKEQHPQSPLLRKTSKKVAAALQSTVSTLLQSGHLI